MKTIAFLLLLSGSFVVHAQVYLSGKVTDSSTHEPLIGTHVLVMSAGKGTLTDVKGVYKIVDLEPGDYEVEFSFIGYTTVRRKITIEAGKASRLDLQLEQGEIMLSDVVVSANIDRPVNTLSQVDLKLRPVATSQDVLRVVPGLFIAQHAGGGKAEQIFLRGFDIDHGTDINLQVDGMPVNMVSHAHGQGYADLHFLIPEMIGYVDFDTGPYYADKGDFTTAGYASFHTRHSLDRNFIKAEGGEFGTARTVTAINLLPDNRSENTNAYVAGEYFRSDGYFDNPQDFHRLNLFARFNHAFNDKNFISATASFLDSDWNASGQIPERAIESGLITRFGSIDNSEGGNTRRASISAIHTITFLNGASLEQQAYGIRYDFNLFSNFTFFLNDPVHGDEIQQKESRMIYGYKVAYNQTSSLWTKELRSEIGAGIRLDDVNDIILAHVEKRHFLNDIKRGDLNEGNFNLFVIENLTLNNKWSVNAGVRMDHFLFRYKDRLSAPDQSVSKTAVNPEVTLNYKLNDKLLFYLRSGTGFHSNDARVVVEEHGYDILPRAYGVDLGANIKVNDKIFLHTALWRLDLDQEFVYVGDEGIVEPSGKTKREGFDFSGRYQLMPWLFADTDVNLTIARSKDNPEGQNYIPLAPAFSTVGGLTIKRERGFNGSIRYRLLGDRPADESNDVVANGYFVTDLILNYTKPGYEAGLSIQNLFNTKWKEAQFDTMSRLKDETQPVSEIHFTPGTPMFIKLQMTFFF